ncbi:MAG: DUF929 family protein [Solirubrobacteraceae bacterium]
MQGTGISQGTMWRTRTRRHHRLALLLAGIAVLAFAGSAIAATPQRSMVQAYGRMVTIVKHAHSHSVKTTATDAATRLAIAAFSQLWSSPSEVVAPSFGTLVFTNSAAALNDIQRLQRSVHGLGATSSLIAGADRRVAQGAISAAQGGKKALLSASTRQLAAGDRALDGGHGVTAVAHYTAAWNDAFKALTELVTKAVTHVPSSAIAAAATNALGSKQIGLAGPAILSNQPRLTLNGKPALLYIGAEGCPYCGMQRWGLIVALSRFGKFSNLHLMQSLTTERPEVRTFTFFGSRYSSPYVAFVPVEATSNVPSGNGFASLQPISPVEQQLFDTYDTDGTYPFIDVGNVYTSWYSTVLPQKVAGMNWTQIVRSLRHPNSVAGQAVAGEAEVLTAELCGVTNGRPASVCSSALVAQYQQGLPTMDGQGGGCPANPALARRRTGAPLAGTARCHI